MLDSMHPVLLVINLVVPDSVVIERVKNRWTHLPSGRVYNIGFNDPKEPVKIQNWVTFEFYLRETINDFHFQGKDDVTGEELCRRPDDEPEVVIRRLNEFKTKTSSVIEYYDKRGVLRTFAGLTTDNMWSDIVKHIQPFMRWLNELIYLYLKSTELFIEKFVRIFIIRSMT